MKTKSAANSRKAASFAITAAGVVPCGGPRKSPCTSSILQNICFSFDPLTSVRVF